MAQDPIWRTHRMNLSDLAVQAQRTTPTADPVADAVRQIRQRLAESRLRADQQRDEVIRLAEETVQQLPLTAQERATALETFTRELFGFGPLDPYMQDPTVTEIIVDGPDHVDIERGGRLERVPVRWPSNDVLHEYLKSLIQRTGRPLDLAHPIVNAEVAGHRINITAPPVTVFDTLNIRKSVAKTQRYTPVELVRVGALDPPGMRLMLLLYRAGANMLICGKTGAGKTTVARGLIEYGARAGTRFLALEDTREIEADVERFVSLQTVERQEFPITMDDLSATVKRKRPDRIIIGEVRTGAHAVPYLMSIMGGHEGTLATMHAGTPEEAFHSFVFFLSSAKIAVREEFLLRVLHQSIHVLVFVTLFTRKGVRRVTRIVAVDPHGTFHDLYRWNFRQHTWEWAVDQLPPRLEDLCYIAEVPVPSPADTVTIDDLAPERLELDDAETEAAP